jgi:uncharacterized protein (DUF1800 family)
MQFPRITTCWQTTIFENFRTLIEEVTLSSVMGKYLDMLNNPKENPSKGALPNENFARELMQLFTIGLYELNDDGTIKLDSKSLPIATYEQQHVMALAGALTGWHPGDGSFGKEEMSEWPLSLTYEESIAGDSKKLVDHLNLLMTGDSLSVATKNILIARVNAASSAKDKVSVAVKIILGSSEFMIKR